MFSLTPSIRPPDPLPARDTAALVADEFVLEPSAPFEVPGKPAPIGTFLLRPEAQRVPEYRASSKGTHRRSLTAPAPSRASSMKKTSTMTRGGK